MPGGMGGMGGMPGMGSMGGMGGGGPSPFDKLPSGTRYVQSIACTAQYETSGRCSDCSLHLCLRTDTALSTCTTCTTCTTWRITLCLSITVCSVLVKGLKGAPEHNGKRGTVRQYDGGKGRYVVELGGGAPLSLKQENLQQVYIYISMALCISLRRVPSSCVAFWSI